MDLREPSFITALKVIQKDALIGAKTKLQLLKVKLDDVKNQLPAADIDLDFGYWRLRRSLRHTFWTIHMMAKSPLNSIMTACLRTLSPTCMAENSEKVEVYFNILLKKPTRKCSRVWMIILKRSMQNFGYSCDRKSWALGRKQNDEIFLFSCFYWCPNIINWLW